MCAILSSPTYLPASFLVQLFALCRCCLSFCALFAWFLLQQCPTLGFLLNTTLLNMINNNVLCYCYSNGCYQLPPSTTYYFLHWCKSKDWINHAFCIYTEVSPVQNNLLVMTVILKGWRNSVTRTSRSSAERSAKSCT